jgi:thioredoxin-related protein
MWMYRWLIFSIIVGMSLPAIAQNKIKWASWNSSNEFTQKGSKKYMIYICYGGCKWCKQMEDSTFSDGQVAKYINANFVPLKLNATSKDRIIIDDKIYTTKQQGGHEFNELAIQLLNGNMKFPSIVFLDEQFDKITSYNQFIDLNNFEMLLTFYAGDYYKKTPWKRFECTYSKETHFNVPVRGN